MKGKQISHNSRTLLRNLEKDQYLNINIFQNEKDYKMKPSLSFSENEEASCQKVLFMRNIKIIYIISIYYFFRLIIDFFRWKVYSTFYLLLRIPIFIICFFNHLFVIRINRFITNMFSIRILFEVCAIFIIICNCFSEFNKGEDEFLSFEIFFSVFVMGIALNYGFVLNLKSSLIFHLIDGSVLLAFHGHKNNICIKRFFLNVFSQKIIITFGYILCSIWLQYINSKPLRELWALYDSFKKSYFSLKSILEDTPYPIVIVKKDLSVIYYKNKELDKCFYRLKKVKPQTEINFIDMFNLGNPIIRKLFRNEIEKGKNKNCQTFMFPYAHSFQFKESSFFPTLFRIDPYQIENSNAKFLQFCVRDYLWKGECESYYIIITERPIRNSGEIILLNNLHKINQEEKKFISNLNDICRNSPVYTTSTQKIETHKSPVVETNGNSTNVNKNRKSPHIICNKIRLPAPNYLSLSKTSILSKRNIPPQKKLSINSFVNLQSSPIYFQLLNKLSCSKKNLFPSLYPYLFYIKFNLNYLSDLILTNNFFDSLLHDKCYDIHRFNFNSFLHYMIHYLTPISKINNFKISIKNDLNEEIEANYYCIRVLIFNILMFIFNNSRDMKEKTLEIRVEHVLFGKQNGCYYRINFSFNEANSHFSYETLSKFFEGFDIGKFYNVDMIKLNSIVDFGLLVSSLIANKVFPIEGDNQKSFVISSCPKKISVIIYVLEKSNGKSPLMEHYKAIDTTISEFEKKAIDKIALIYYKSVYEEKKKSMINQPLDLKNNLLDNIYDTGKEDECNNYFFKIHLFVDLIEEETEISLEKDLAFSHDFKIRSLIYKKDINDKRYYLCNIDNKKLNQINISSIILNPQRIIQKTKIVGLFNTVIMKQYTYSFCKTPRFLIVEDNLIGRIGVVDKLRQIKFKFLFDIAVDGDIAIEKYKSMLNRGYLFDFIFMDIGLININGIEATREIRAIERELGIHTNIICVSVNAKLIFDTQSISINELNGNLFDDYCK